MSHDHITSLQCSPIGGVKLGLRVIKQVPDNLQAGREGIRFEHDRARGSLCRVGEDMSNLPGKLVTFSVGFPLALLGGNWQGRFQMAIHDCKILQPFKCVSQLATTQIPIT